MSLVVLDTEVVLRFYLNEIGSDVVERYLKNASESRERVLINIINLAEISYILSRSDPQMAGEKIQSLRSFGIQIVSIEDDSLWKIAASIKANQKIPLADAFAAAYFTYQILLG